MTLKGQKYFVYAFVHAYISDMPQQQANSGYKTQRATLGCRFCLIGKDERHSMKYDTVMNRRYHH